MKKRLCLFALVIICTLFAIVGCNQSKVSKKEREFLDEKLGLWSIEDDSYVKLENIDELELFLKEAELDKRDFQMLYDKGELLIPIVPDEWGELEYVLVSKSGSIEFSYKSGEMFIPQATIEAESYVDRTPPPNVQTEPSECFVGITIYAYAQPDEKITQYKEENGLARNSRNLKSGLKAYHIKDYYGDGLESVIKYLFYDKYEICFSDFTNSSDFDSEIERLEFKKIKLW